MHSQNTKKTTPAPKAVYVPRSKNSDVRHREYLTPAEVERLISAAAKLGEYPLRDQTLILLAYVHGLRASEVCGLLWSQISWEDKVLNVERCKGSLSMPHPIQARELKLLKQLRKQSQWDYVFPSERNTHLGRNAFYRVVLRAGQAAGFAFPVHPHMLRHACGYKLANDGKDVRLIQAYLGHRNIQNTVRYTEVNPERFKGLFT